MAGRGRSARNKGAAAEREFFALLNKFLPERLRIQRKLGQARDGGDDGDAAGVSIEVKRQERLMLAKWLEQAKDSAGDNYPAVVFRQNNKQWRCIVEMTPLELAAFMRYTNNIGDTVKSIERSISEL
jgi:hypothetical protein